MPYQTLPAAVQATCARYFGSSEGLKAHKGLEGAQTFCEAEGNKGGRIAAIKLIDSGKIMEMA